MRRGAALAALIVIVAAAGDAQESTDPHSAQPERPTVATHAYTVWPGYSEVEFGLELDELAGTETFSTPTTYKVGITHRTQIEATFSWASQSGGSTAQGFSDLVLAFKWRVTDSLPLFGAFAIQPALRLPVGAAAFTSDDYVGSLLLISSQKIGPVELDLNFGAFIPITSGDFPHLGDALDCVYRRACAWEFRVDRRAVRLPGHQRRRQRRAARRIARGAHIPDARLVRARRRRDLPGERPPTALDIRGAHVECGTLLDDNGGLSAVDCR